MSGGEFAASLIANFAWASLLMLAILAIRRPFARLFGAGPAYALWLLPALRLVAPPLPDWAPELPVPGEETVVLFVDATSPVASTGSGQGEPLLLAAWGFGAAIFLVWQVLSYLRFRADLARNSRSRGAHHGITVLESDAVEGPLAIGLISRKIVVPVEFGCRYSAEERRLALEHEAVHHRRGDLWWNHLALLVLALNWFNPIAWIAFRAFRADQELACDAAVTGSQPQIRQDYARALIKSASRPGLIAACPLNHADQLKRRLKMMQNHEASRLRLVGGTAAVALLAGVSLALGSPGFAAQQDEAKQDKSVQKQERREERIIIRTRHAGDEHDEHAEHREHGAGGDGAHQERRVIIMTHDGHGEHSEGAHDRHVSTFRLHRDDGDDAHVIGAECAEGQRTEVHEGGGEGSERTRVILCSHGNAAPAQHAERLREIRERIANQSGLSAEHRQRVLAAIDREIARLSGQQ